MLKRRPIAFLVLAAALLVVGAEPRWSLAASATGHRISGHIPATLECTGDYPGVLVALEPLGRTAVSAGDGTFAFLDVPDGEYQVIVDPGCPPSDYCTEPIAVQVHGADLFVEACFNPSTCAADHIRVEPVRVRPGGTIDVSGRCYYVHSGAGIIVYVDDQRAADLDGSTAGGYETVLAVPVDAAPGSHQVRVVAFSTNMEIARANFEVVAAIASCPGDCNADGSVTVDELVAGVQLALGERGRPACEDAFCSAECGPGPGAFRPPGVACLVRAVQRAAGGCPTSLCTEPAECDDGNSFTQDACMPSGCTNTCLAAGP